MSLIYFENTPIIENNDPLVDLSKSAFLLEPFWLGHKISDVDKMYLRKSVVDKLVEIQDQMHEYKFKIWDGFRSRQTQTRIHAKLLEDLTKLYPTWSKKKLSEQARKFITPGDDPLVIPPHLTGGSVDLTLVDAQGRDIDMGTPFNSFGLDSQALYFESENMNDVIRFNRRTLRESMLGAGFRQDPLKWWHFDYGNQLWAHDLKKPNAIFGEATVPK
jgi:D-alanyl-D-alanine dipeptidase